MARLYHIMGVEFEQKTVDAFEKSLKKKELQQVNDK
jgi:hypothetical protein